MRRDTQGVALRGKQLEVGAGEREGGGLGGGGGAVVKQGG